MDNKQDRQLYWEVKQFFQGTPNMVPPPLKTSSLRDAAASVMNENKPFSQAKPPSHSNVFDATGSMLNAMKSLEAKNNPGHIAYTKNGSTNPFTLNENFMGMSPRPQADVSTRGRSPKPEDRPEISDEEISVRGDVARSSIKIREKGERGFFQGAADMADTGGQGIVSDTINSAVGGIGRMFGQVDDTSTDTKTLRANSKIQATADGSLNQGRVDTIYKNAGLGGSSATPAPRTATPGAPAPTSAAPGTAPTTPAPTSTAPGAPAPTSTPTQTEDEIGWGKADAEYKAKHGTPAKPAPAGGAPATPATPAPTGVAPATPTGTAPPSRVPGKNVPPISLGDKASDNPEEYEDKQMILNKPTFKVSNPITMPKFASSNTSMGNRTSGGPSAGQYRGSSNMGMAPGPQRQERQTLQSTMAQQNQKSTSDSLGQMGSVQGTSSSSSGGFQGSVLPSTLGSPRTNKTSEFKYSSGSRLS